MPIPEFDIRCECCRRAWLECDCIDGPTADKDEVLRRTVVGCNCQFDDNIDDVADG